MTDFSPATITSGAAADHADDGRAKRNVWVLAAAQGVGGLATMNIFATAALAGVQLAPDARWATLPVSTYIIGTALTTYPASMFMQHYGRRAGFMLGALGGLIGSLLAAYAILRGDFALFCIATFIAGSHQAFAQYYRFAATDVASPGFAPKAVSYVLAGALVGALFGPVIINNTRDLFAPVLFAGNYAATALLLAVSIGVLAFIDLPKPRSDRVAQPPIGALLKRKRLLVAMLAGMMAYGMMNLLMTATPLAMVGCGLSTDQAAWVIQWHVLAMFAPSFFTGALIVRYGAERIIAVGLLLNAAAAVVGMTGLRLENFGFGLVLLGLGWNFAYIGATTMLTACHEPHERGRVQGLNDTAVFITVALTSLASGQLLESYGWFTLNLLIFPMLAIAAASLAWLAVKMRAKPSAAQ